MVKIALQNKETIFKEIQLGITRALSIFLLEVLTMHRNKRIRKNI
jgi:hypothetical protein